MNKNQPGNKTAATQTKHSSAAIEEAVEEAVVIAVREFKH